MIHRCLTSSNLLEAADLLSQCVSILRNITSEFCFLTIQVNHLRIVLKSKSLYFSILHAIPDIIPEKNANLLGEDVFKQAIKFRTNLLEFFLRQRMLVQDLEKLLDSTNNMVYSKEIMSFLDIDYKTSPISLLCCTSEDELILNPDVCHYLTIHRLEICSNLFLLLKSIQATAEYTLEETNLNKEVGLSTIHSRIFVPTFEYVSKTISEYSENNTSWTDNADSLTGYQPVLSTEFKAKSANSPNRFTHFNSVRRMLTCV